MIFQELLDFKNQHYSKIEAAQYYIENFAQTQENFVNSVEVKDDELKRIHEQGVRNMSLANALGHVRVWESFKPFRLPVDQAIELALAKSKDISEELFFSLKIPFERVFVDFNTTLHIAEERLKGVLFYRAENQNNDTIFVIHGITERFLKCIYEKTPYLNRETGYNAFLEELDQHIPMSMMVPEPAIDDLTKEAYEKSHDGTEEWGEFSKKFVRNFCLYVNSVNVKIIQEEGRQTKKRRKQNKPIPEPYYFCKLERKEVHIGKHQEGNGTKHKYQYDVRGHFKEYKDSFVGKKLDKPKIIWCPPHIRGPKDAPYIPKTYLVK